MNIQNIQIAQGLVHAVERKSGSGKGENSAESNPSLPDKTLSDNLNVNKVYYPPLFPLGHTQGIYDVVQAKPDSLSADSAEARKTIVERDQTATNKEYVAAGQQVVSDKNGMIKNNNMPAVKDTISPGSVLDLEI